MPYAHDEKKLKIWETGRANSIAKDPAAWNTYDVQVQAVVQTYNGFLTGKGGYQKLDWQWVKAMLWVESGADSPEWTVKPMQIGVPHDPGLTGLLTTSAGKLILPPEYAKVLTFASVTTNPVFNIEAGTGYLLQRLAFFGMVAAPTQAELAESLNHLVGAGSALLGSSLPGLQTSGTLLLNFATLGMFSPLAGAAQSTPATAAPAARPPGAGAPLHHPSVHKHGTKAKKPVHRAPHKQLHQAITGWRPVSSDVIAQRYNGGGDGNYSSKLQFCYDMVRGQIDPADPFPKPAPAQAGKK